MTLTCQYCGKTMANKQNLVRHQNSKTCLATRDDDVVIENRFQCEFCNKNLCSNDRLKTHNNTCIKRYKKLLDDKDQRITELEEEKCKLLNDKDQRITELEEEKCKLLNDKDQRITELEEEKCKLLNDKNEEIAELKLQIRTTRIETENEMLRKDSQYSKEVIERIAEQPKTTNTNNTNNTKYYNTTNNNLVLPMIDTSQERIERIVDENYTENHFWDGQKGVAHFTKDNLLYDSENNLGYICTDASRKTFKRKGENGEIIKDLKALQLTQNIAGPIRKKAGEHATNISVKNPNLIESVGKKFFDVNNIHRDNSVFITELACITSI